MEQDNFLTGRRAARRSALQVLYEIDSVGHSWEDVVGRFKSANDLSGEDFVFAQELLNGVRENSGYIDELISRFAQSWPMDQLSLVDRSLLRLAIFELVIYGESPYKVVINEAVELAKGFGSENSSKFVNGVLGSVVAAAKT